MATSEVARLLQQIDIEYEAAQRGLEGPAITTRHAFIRLAWSVSPSIIAR